MVSIRSNDCTTKKKMGEKISTQIVGTCWSGAHMFTNAMLRHSYNKFPPPILLLPKYYVFMKRRGPLRRVFPCHVTLSLAHWLSQSLSDGIINSGLAFQRGGKAKIWFRPLSLHWLADIKLPTTTNNNN